MKPEHWEKIEELFHDTSQLPPHEQNRYLDEACGEDVALKRDVLALLASLQECGDFIERPPLAGAISSVVNQTTRQSLIGQSIGHYQVEALLGSGGMGEVYLARDLSLDRPVALKMLPSEFVRDSEHVQRFEREARAASALNNPNIITIYEIGQDGDSQFIATEFVKGRTLRQKLVDGPLTQRELIDVASQIASAVSAAHSAGIIHRDIKPENVMIRDDGLVKVLDFGLAKPLNSPEASTSIQASPRDIIRTNPEIYVGTVSYMSPEQVLREDVDHRADIFGLGVVMYEMATGKRPFKGETSGEIFEAILRHEVNLDQEAHVAAGLRRIIKRALQKSRDARYQKASELGEDLGMLARETITPRQKKWIASAGMLVCGLLAVTVFFYVKSHSNNSTVLSAKPLVIANSFAIAQEQGTEAFPSISPDGVSLIYSSAASGTWDIYLKRIGEREAINLTRDFSPSATQPSLSPDGKQVAFRSDGILVMNATGEGIRRLTDEGYNPAWSPDSKEIVYATDRVISPDRTNIPSQLWITDVESGSKSLISKGDAVQPSWSPHGHRIAYWKVERGGRRNVWTIAANGGDPVVAIDDDFENWNPVWSPDGAHLYFVSDRSGTMNLWRLPINEVSGAPSGPAEPITIPSAYIQQVSFSRDGKRMAYTRVDKKANIKEISFDDKTAKIVGTPRPILQGSSLATQPDVSGDERKLVFSSLGEQREDLFTISLQSGSREKVALTSDSYKDRMPRWSPDGQKVAFYSDRSGNYEIWIVNKDGSDLRQLTGVATKTEYTYCPVWSPDGLRLAYYLNNINTFIVDASSRDWRAQNPEPLPEADPTIKNFLPSSWSDDGSMLAGWRKVGSNQFAGILVYSFTNKTYEQLTERGASPRWLSDNRRILFSDYDKLQIVDRFTKRVSTVLDIAPAGFFGFSLSKNQRRIYFTHASTELDIWVSDIK